MSFVGRGSYFAAAVAGVASAFYIFEPEFIELKRQRDATAQIQTASPAANSTPAAVQPSSPPIAASGRWQEMQSRDGRTYWMNLDTGTALLIRVCRSAALLCSCSLHWQWCSLHRAFLFPHRLRRSIRALTPFGRQRQLDQAAMTRTLQAHSVNVDRFQE